MVRRWGFAVSIGTGVVISVTWVFAWLYLLGRLYPHLWLTEGINEFSLQHLLSWIVAPLLATFGGVLGARIRNRAILSIAAPMVVLLVMLANVLFVDTAGSYNLADGVNIAVEGPDREGTTTRLFTLDFKANPNLEIGIYDRDSDDSQPYDDKNTSYFATPALSVFQKLGPGALCVTNAGFFTWTKKDRIASHIATVVQNGQVRYNVLNDPHVWTFGWKVVNGRPDFRLIQGVPFKQVINSFDTALGMVRPLVAGGKALKLGPGAGVTRMKCSRTSLGWSSESSKLYILIVRDPDGERGSINTWKSKRRQVGGWDLPQIQQFWMKMGIDHAIILDGGDSTQLVYKNSRATKSIGSGRLGITLLYLRERPLRIWLPIFPLCHSASGVINYIYVKQ